MHDLLYTTTSAALYLNNRQYSVCVAGCMLCAVTSDLLLETCDDIHSLLHDHQLGQWLPTATVQSHHMTQLFEGIIYVSNSHSTEEKEHARHGLL